MSEPTGEQSQSRPKVRRGQVVSFVFHDALTGRDLDGLGVVLGADTGPDGEQGDQLAVRPLADHLLFVSPEDVSPVTASDVAPG